MVVKLHTTMKHNGADASVCTRLTTLGACVSVTRTVFQYAEFLVEIIIV